VGGGVRASLPDGGAMSASVAAAIEVALIDLSSIAYPIWHVSGSEPDQDFCSRQIVARVRALTRTYPHAAICCDSGRSFRNDLSPAYKANRPPAEASLKHQIRLAEEQLAADGFPVWKVKGYEADDLIASGARLAVEAGASVLVVSGDKDLMQLVSGDVRVLSPASNTTYDAEAVRVKFGVRPEQIRDYLTLVGDAADNVKGAAGIGPKRAADLLSKWGTLEGVYEALDQHGTQFTPAIATALRNFQAELVTVRALITLDHAVEIPFGEVMAPRVPKAGPQLEDIDMSESVNTVTGEIVETAAPEPVTPEPAAAPEPVEAPKAEAPQPATSKPANGNGAPKDPIVLRKAARAANARPGGAARKGDVSVEPVRRRLRQSARRLEHDPGGPGTGAASNGKPAGLSYRGRQASALGGFHSGAGAQVGPGRVFPLHGADGGARDVHDQAQGGSGNEPDLHDRGGAGGRAREGKVRMGEKPGGYVDGARLVQVGAPRLSGGCFRAVCPGGIRELVASRLSPPCG
jgi:5'-3' exonuclease